MEHTSDDSDDLADVMKADFKKLSNKANKAGYAEGASQGHDSAFQSGFDQGYEDGLRWGFEFEKFRSFYRELKINSSTPEELQQEKSKFEEQYQDTNAKDAKHFQFREMPNATMSEISQKQHAYIDEFEAQCLKELPHGSKLLNDAMQEGLKNEV